MFGDCLNNVKNNYTFFYEGHPLPTVVMFAHNKDTFSFAKLCGLPTLFTDFWVISPIAVYHGLLRVRVRFRNISPRVQEC